MLAARCRQDAGLFGLRVEERPDSWYVTWSFRINETAARREKYEDTIINGTIQIDPGFAVCPRCAADSFVQCGLCGRLSCWVGGEPQWFCKWSPCPGFGSPSGQIRSVTAQGDR
ncbi:hypothetical protein [Lentzea sp. E54]|uniref:hypothetical protein n=1 Tax=Lentzea xerophila TaxID=3435883 RepID=UPI003DA25517